MNNSLPRIETERVYCSEVHLLSMQWGYEHHGVHGFADPVLLHTGVRGLLGSVGFCGESEG